MSNQAIIDEVTAKLKALPGAVAYEWDVKRIATTPAFLVGLPDRIAYRTTYNRNSRKLTLTVVVLVGDANTRSSTKKLMDLTEPANPNGFFQLVDSQFVPYSTCDDVTVVDCEPDMWINAGVSYLGAEFTLDIIATGA
ncbi:MAG TPA: hypothetical protein VK878_23185 [Candidatus Deferrimicrobiaceae bacterium]|nr:hypothetical protein [Candidatus Deferrimicrobiaceae bacterium]